MPLTSKETTALLSKLCVDYGICLPMASAHLGTPAPADIDSFTNAVFSAEGLSPEGVDRHLYRQARAQVAEAFRQHVDEPSRHDSR